MTFAPMKHQLVSIERGKTTPITFDCSDPGTGKTAVRIWLFAERRRNGGKCALVLAPKSLMSTTWRSDFKKFAPDMKVSIAYAVNREAAFDAAADVYVTNHDAIKWLDKQKDSFFDIFDELIIDESTAYKHHTSLRSRALKRLISKFKYRSCLTATPNGSSITDIWHQAFILDNGRRLGPSFFHFRATCCEAEQIGRGREMIKWRDRPGAEEAVFGLLNDIVVRHKFEDCVDIPDHHEYTLDFDMSSTMWVAYKQLEKDSILPFVHGQQVITAVNAAAIATKLLQICSGAVYDNDGKIHWIDDERYNLILDLVEERVHYHPLVFFYWIHQRNALVKEAIKRKLRYAIIDGTVSDKERDLVVQNYQNGLVDVLFAHPKSAAHGMTLTRGRSIIWTGPTYDAELYKQGSKRQYRIGQQAKTENIMILAKDTKEHWVYEILQGKNDRMRTLLDLFQTI